MLKDTGIIVPKTHDEIQRMFNALRGTKTIVADTETSGLDKLRNFVCGYVFTVGPRPDETWYLPVRHKGGGNVPGCRTPEHATDFNPLSPKDRHPLEAEIKAIADDQSKHWVGHNLKYDMWMLSRHGIYLSGTVEDTRVNASLINELQGKYGLEDCAEIMQICGKDLSIYKFISDYMAAHGIKVADNHKAMEYFWWLPGDQQAARYAGRDGTTTYDLWQKQLLKIDEEELGRVHAVEKRVTKTLFRMEHRGTPVDGNKVELVEAKIAARLKEAKKSLPDSFNVRAPTQMKALMEKHGHTEWPLTPTGKPSFPEKWLEGFAVGKDVIAVRKLENLVNTFINGHIKSNLWHGRVYPNFNQIKIDEFGTVSGRLSCNDPNLLQIPKRDKVIAPLLRQVFRPQGPFKWWSADYSQQEYRVFAHFAKAKAILDAYARDPRTDYHQLVADMLNVERDPAAKRINLGTIYNMGVAKLAEGLGVEISVAADYMRRMRAIMPEAKQFNKDAELVAKRRGYVKTKLGRRRRFPNGINAHKAGNGVIQGSSADATKLKMCEIDEYLVSENAKSGLIIQIYDSLEFEYLDEEIHHMEECMRIMQSFGPEDPIHFEVPMVADISIGESWGHATFGEKYKEWV